MPAACLYGQICWCPLLLLGSQNSWAKAAAPQALLALSHTDGHVEGGLQDLVGAAKQKQDIPERFIAKNAVQTKFQ